MAERSIFSVDQFKSNMTGGGARANQFFVALSFPDYVGAGAAASVQGAFLCSATTLPGSVVNPTSCNTVVVKLNSVAKELLPPGQSQS